MRLSNRIWGWLWRRPRVETSPVRAARGPVSHVVILDGTMSSLEPGRESNPRLLYELLCEAAPQARLSLRYEAGIQWRNWSDMRDVIEGRGINRQIRRAYGYLASRYRPGDRIFLFGYSRGAYAVRSLAGLIDQVGLLKARHATERNVALAYRHYQGPPETAAAQAFRAAYCHAASPIEMVGVWDTVKALGLRLPLIWRLSEPTHAFHSHALGESVKSGFHALAHDETREAYEPVLWHVTKAQEGRVEQMWFPGTHGDVGGQINGHQPARPLANLSLVWMLARAQHRGLPLPDAWRARFPTDTAAPSMGHWVGWSKLFVLRKKRLVLMDLSERMHPALTLRLRAREQALHGSQRFFPRFRVAALGKAK